MMDVVGGVVTTGFLVGLAIFAWWAVRPPKVQPEKKSDDGSGLVLSDVGDSGDGGGD